jgi:ABC-2 type transport system permease protein
MVAKHLALIWACARFNLAAAMEYRGAFVAQCLGMMLNDAFLLIFWAIYFDSFPSVEGWGLRDLLVLWGIVATSFGIGVTIFGNCVRLATLIVQGQLDYFLPMPKNVLLHSLVSRMSLSGWGDLSFGLVALLVAAVTADPWFLPLALVLVLLSAAIFIAFGVLVNSLAFFIGNAEAAAMQTREAVTNFSLYPAPIFRGWVRLMLLTALPAGFMGHVPVKILRDFDAGWLGLLALFACFSWAAALAVFRRGLRRYESGNLIVLRG